MQMYGPPLNDLDLNIYRQGHDPEQFRKGFSHRSLFVKK